RQNIESVGRIALADDQIPEVEALPSEQPAQFPALVLRDKLQEWGVSQQFVGFFRSHRGPIAAKNMD
ncbi:MAG TPA: hypothetical protein VKG78_12820, partial [Opitutaceae bacterium]|nr:hypothetical protein [Opitutaceae bacterium]